MSRPYENFENWMKKDNKTKEDFIQKNKDTWSKSIPQKFNVSISQPLILFGYDQEQATLSTKEIVTVSKEFYEIIRKKFREYKYQISKQHKSRIQARISKSTTSKLEQIKKKLEHSNASGTLEHIINSFDEDKLQQKIHINNLQVQIQKLRDYEEYIKSKHKLELKEAHALNKKTQDYLFSQWVAATLKLKILDQHISTQDDIDHIYESFDQKEKEAAQAKIITELKSRLEDKILNIKASLKPASDDIIPLNINTSLNFHEKTIIPPRFSGYAKGHPTSHKSSVSENLPEENPDTEIPSIKTNTEHSHLREDQLNPFKKKY